MATSGRILAYQMFFVVQRLLMSLYDLFSIMKKYQLFIMQLIWNFSSPVRKFCRLHTCPEKRPAELDFIRNLFHRLYKQYKQIPWICIDKVNEVKVAEILSKSAIFISTSLYEGFGLPPLEAMACGCAVVGFHGGGGLEYASNDNGFWCEEGNVIECVKTLGNVVSLINNNDEKINKVKEQALKKTSEYTFDRQERELLNFWSKAYK